MDSVEFNKLKRFDQEKRLLVPIIEALQDNGGELMRNELTDSLINAGIVTEDDVNLTNTSKKTGANYRPFLYTFNFALKNLKIAGFLDYQRNKPITLTSKGLNCDCDKMNIDVDVYEISSKYWSEKSKGKRDKGEEEIERLSDEEDKNKEEILQRITSLDPKKFEGFSRGLLKKMGIEIDDKKGIAYSNDGGIDGFGYCVDKQSLKTTRVAIQCKRWQHSVGAPEVNNLRGAVNTHIAEYGILITTSYFSKAAIESAKTGGTPITLIDGRKLVDLMIEYGYKVRVVPTYIPDEDYFDN